LDIIFRKHLVIYSNLELEPLHTKYFPLNLMSNLRSQYLPIAFQTKGMYIGSAKNNRTNFTKIVWKKDNVKTLSIHHGYNIQNDEIWKSIVGQMKNCVHVWKSRNLTYTGKTLIVKNLLIS
jgi:hypothetical protein